MVNSDLELTASDRLFTHKNLSLSAWTALRYNHNSAVDIPNYFNESVLKVRPSMMYGIGQTTFRGSMGLQVLWKQWSAGSSFAGVAGNRIVDYLSVSYAVYDDNRLQLASL